MLGVGRHNKNESKVSRGKDAHEITRRVTGSVRTLPCLSQFWSHQVVKFDFTADLTGTGNQSEVVIK